MFRAPTRLGSIYYDPVWIVSCNVPAASLTPKFRSRIVACAPIMGLLASSALNSATCTGQFQPLTHEPQPFELKPTWRSGLESIQIANENSASVRSLCSPPRASRRKLTTDPKAKKPNKNRGSKAVVGNDQVHSFGEYGRRENESGRHRQRTQQQIEAGNPAVLRLLRVQRAKQRMSEEQALVEGRKPKTNTLHFGPDTTRISECNQEVR